MDTIHTNNDTEGEDVLTSIDNALAEELAQAEQEREQSARAARAAHTRAVRLGTALRFAGVSILIMAAAAFITQRWVDSSHVTRYGLFLAFTLLVTSAGLFCSRVDGSELAYNQDDVSLPDLIVCRPELAEAIVDFVKRNGTD